MRVAYDVLVGFHVACALVGFGAVAISGAYGALGRRPENAAELKRYLASPGRAEYLILVAPVFGVGALAVRPSGSDFWSLWAIAGLVIWVLASGLLLGVVRPAEDALRRGGTGAARLMWAAGASDALFVIALFLMVTQPG